MSDDGRRPANDLQTRQARRQQARTEAIMAEQLERLGRTVAHTLPPGSIVSRVVRGVAFRVMLDSAGRAHLLRPGTRPTLAELDAREGRGAVGL